MYLHLTTTNQKTNRNIADDSYVVYLYLETLLNNKSD